MRKQLLINYLKGETTPQQSEEIMRWIGKDEANSNYLAKLKMMYIASTMPQERASREEFEAFKMRTMHPDYGGHQPDSRAAEPQTTPDGRAAEPQTNKAYLTKLKRTRIALYISAAIGAAAVVMLFISLLSDSSHLRESLKNELLTELKNGSIKVGLSNMPQESLNTFYTEKGVKSTIILPDGTNVKLNSNTRITFPNRFIGKTREVHLSGEAFFDVVSDSLHPLVLTTDRDLVIKVTGTKFNIKSYPDDNKEEATLYEGRISLISKEGDTYNMLPDNQLIVTPHKKPVKVDSPKMDDIKAWTEGRLVFEDTPLSDVIKMLERWHGVEFVISDNSVLDKTITGTFSSESIYQIMHIINLCASVEYHIKDNIVTLL